MPTLQDQLIKSLDRDATARMARQTPRVDSDPPSSVAMAAELARCQYRIDAVASILGGWIWETDAEHRFTYMSPSVTRFSGREPEWHYGKTRQELGNLSVKTADGRSWVEQLDARQNFGPVDFLRYLGDKVLWMRTVGQPKFDTNGTFTGYCGVAFELPDGAIDDSDIEPEERRGAPRRRLVRAAELAMPGLDTAIACVVLDVSTTGARVRLPSSAPLPATLRLKVEGLTLDTPCALRWRRSDEAGLEFLS